MNILYFYINIKLNFGMCNCSVPDTPDKKGYNTDRHNCKVCGGMFHSNEAFCPNCICIIIWFVFPYILPLTAFSNETKVELSGCYLDHNLGRCVKDRKCANGGCGRTVSEISSFQWCYDCMLVPIALSLDIDPKRGKQFKTIRLKSESPIRGHKHITREVSIINRRSEQISAKILTEQWHKNPNLLEIMQMLRTSAKLFNKVRDDHIGMMNLWKTCEPTAQEMSCRKGRCRNCQPIECEISSLSLQSIAEKHRNKYTDVIEAFLLKELVRLVLLYL
uniref:Uncharacterized protein n=1 Tax=viral metagenome TaxID=1070528 RepID=A0A6C0E088_9ZZZZ